MTNGLLAASPPITGLDPSIVISPPRLHLTLGVMSLSESRPEGTSAPVLGDSIGRGGASEGPQLEEQTAPPKTISDAIDFLQSLEPEIQQILQGQPLRLVLDELSVMRRSKSGEADVMYLGPSNATVKTEEHAQTFKALRRSRSLECNRFRSDNCEETVHDRFREAGFVTETRPLKVGHFNLVLD